MHAGDRVEMTNEVSERGGEVGRWGGGEDNNNEQKAPSTGTREPSVKKIRQTKSTNVISSANQMLLQKSWGGKKQIREK